MLTYISPSRATKNNVNVGETKQLQVGIWSTGLWPASTRIQCQLLFLSTLFGLELETRQFSRWKIQNISKTSQKISSKGYLLYMMHIKTIKIRKVKGLFLYSTSPWKSEPRPKTQDLIINYVKWIYGVPCLFMFSPLLRESNYNNLKTSEVKLRLLQGDLSHLNAGEIEHQHIELIWNSSKVSAWDVKITPMRVIGFFSSPKTERMSQKRVPFQKGKGLAFPITIGFRGVMSNMLSSTCRGSIGQ